MGQFYQHFTSSFYVGRSQIQKDGQVVESLFALLVSIFFNNFNVINISQVFLYESVMCSFDILSLCFFAKMKPPKSSLQNFLEISYLCPHSIFGHKMFQKICFKIKNLYKSVRFTYKFQFFNR